MAELPVYLGQTSLAQEKLFYARQEKQVFRIPVNLEYEMSLEGEGQTRRYERREP